MLKGKSFLDNYLEVSEIVRTFAPKLVLYELGLYYIIGHHNHRTVYIIKIVMEKAGRCEASRLFVLLFCAVFVLD